MTQPAAPQTPDQQPTHPAYGPPPGAYPPPPGKPVSPRLAFWTSAQGIICIFAIAAGVTFVVFVLTTVLGPSATPASKTLDVSVTGCEFSGSDSLPSATVEFTVRNTGDVARGATIGIEYRDASGARIDTDTARVKSIPAGDIVRSSETTILDAAASSGTCAIVSVR